MKIPPARGVRTGAVLAVASAAVLAVGGCQSGGGKDDSAGSKASSAPTAAAGTKALNGSTLKTLLLPASAMPKGFHLSPDGSRDTGDGHMQVANSPVPAAKACEVLGQTSWIRVANLNGAAFAQNDYADASQTQQVAQEIDTYKGDGARQVMAKLRKVFAHCATFTDRSGGTPVKVRLRTVILHGVGDEGLKAVETSPTWQGGMTLAAVRVGDAVVTTLYSSIHADKGAAAVTMAAKIAKKVQAAS
ncbi:hypothetical protein [Actinoallomurus rhizosphaericola]|uniref:hypothetical protein n=1 Tax=Actinoallomurus rhizosphaericola TaxID=2952536 RepID=UPI002091C1C6|nr:hypothetical protein [Actinoallomurus rhizosphaericola]MCO5993730.1 hypothetical protein [Actinoallomurus rhizosphaericola]